MKIIARLKSGECWWLPSPTSSIGSARMQKHEGWTVNVARVYRSMIVWPSVCFLMDTSPVAVGGSSIASRTDHVPRWSSLVDSLSSIAIVQTVLRSRRKNEGDGRRGSGLDDEGAEVVVLNSSLTGSWNSSPYVLPIGIAKKELLNRLIKRHIAFHISRFISISIAEKIHAIS